MMIKLPKTFASASLAAKATAKEPRPKEATKALIS